MQIYKYIILKYW